jgi:pimeloyl-ACP methyl ester carboxylesterase
MIDLATREGAAAIAREMVPKLLGATSRAEQPDLEDAVHRLIQMNSTEGIVAALRALKSRPDSTPLLSTINCPTLVISGDEDVIIPPKEAEALHRAIPGSTLKIFPRVGHLSNLETAAAFFGRRSCCRDGSVSTVRAHAAGCARTVENRPVPLYCTRWIYSCPKRSRS